MGRKTFQQLYFYTWTEVANFFGKGTGGKYLVLVGSVVSATAQLCLWSSKQPRHYVSTQVWLGLNTT